MAAMAPALTDAPAEAHRIRFKLAPPSSTLSPSGVEGSGTGNHILVSSNGAVKRKASEERPTRGAGPCKPLVTTYHCSTPVSSAKESSLKLQGVLLQKRGILPSLIPRKHQALEISEEQLKSIMSAGGGGGACETPSVQGTTVNGMAKKVTKSGSDRDNGVTLNGGQHTVEQDLSNQTQVVNSGGGLTRNGPLRDVSEQHQKSTGVSQNCHSNGDPPATSSPSVAPFNPTEDKISDCPPLGSEDALTLSLATQHDPLGGLGAELCDRTQHSQSRQGEIEARLRRLRKRLQVVQAKQVERHVQQQLGGLLESTLGALDARRPRGRHGDDSLTPQERDGLGRFLKGGSMPAELERLSLSCTTNLRSAENAFDSDATESSSGGETDVEEDELARVDVEQRHIPLWRRAEGRYAVDRAAIISHWNWLQAQVSDLEYRIRQQTDIYRQIRSSKGSVLLGEGSACESVPDDSSDSRTETITCPVSRDHDTVGVEGSVSSHGIATETGLRKSCAPGRQVNGVINSFRPGSPNISDPDEHLRSESLQKLSDTLALPAHDSSCVAARTRPLLSCRKRRILRPGSLTSLNRKAQRSMAPRCGCELNTQCVMCSGRTLIPAETQHQLPLLDRLAQFDPCVHPILSFTDDVMMNLHMQRVLKGHWQSRSLEKIKPIKKISLKHKLCMSSRISDPPSRDKHKLSNSLLSTVRLSHLKMRSEKVSRQQSDVPTSASKLDSRQHFRQSSSYDRSHSRKRPREPSLERIENAPKLYMEMGSPCPSLSALNTPTHSPLMRQPSISESPSTPLHLGSSAATIRRRRGESPFDINNIVIPMSVAATTRVEKLQYKEILTPSWREVDVFAKPICEEEDVMEIEDLSDVAFCQLHLPYEEQERSRWSWTASSIAKRRGSRSFKSLDGRTTPLQGGTNPSTPQPSSPDTAHFHMLQEYNSVVSPSSPVSPEMVMLTGLHMPGSRDSHRLLSNEDTRCSTPDTCDEMVPQPVQPWERRTFPLDVEPHQESEFHPSPTSEKPCRTIRRVSGSRSSKSESEAGPSSPLADDGTKQKQTNPPKPTHR